MSALCVRTFLFVVFLVLTVGACGERAPYVYIADEFNRDAETFGKIPTDIEEVVICYTRSKTTPKTIRDLARSECAKVNKVAQFSHQDIGDCPAFTPTAAHFTCHSR